MRIRTLCATQNHCAGKSRMPEFAVPAFAAGDEPETGALEIGDELTDFARHEKP